MSEGVEWAMHSCLNLAWLDSDEAMTAARLAAFYDLPPAYLNKQLQALARVGILTSTPGPRGGFRLARPLEQITLLDVVTAIEGPGDAFRCEQVLRKGPEGRDDVDYRKSCFISQAMRQAELAWRKELAGQTLADIKAKVERASPGTPRATREWFARRRS
ncbi:Rrf2 family transcriptional regulator [Nonomuraea sp. N2-4H]|uniref:RrF2 family transcriptional regulator n=1 Tax=Nonomuraea sp. N2-4H TaxID=3128898 RepID=UPI00324CC2B9